MGTRFHQIRLPLGPIPLAVEGGCPPKNVSEQALHSAGRQKNTSVEGGLSFGLPCHASREREVGSATAAKLRAITAPFILRREKSQVLPDRSASGSSLTGSASVDGRAEDVAAAAEQPQNLPEAMGKKNDFIVWLRLAPMQR